jgi:hypothetical protein
MAAPADLMDNSAYASWHAEGPVSAKLGVPPLKWRTPVADPDRVGADTGLRHRQKTDGRENIE